DFGMDAPQTLDGYEAYLAEAGNSVDGAIVIAEASYFGDRFAWLYGRFGDGNKGIAAGKVVVGEDRGELRFFPMAVESSEMLEYLNGLYGRGLILEDIFSIDRAKFNTFGTDGLLASCATQTPAGFFGDEGDNYVPLRPLTKTSGDAPV